ncbi:DNA polymerase III subunit alpha [Robiginitomaculum antarcticum]|uniref:DNA polymerase III subunit alpha n=1 Tax=Robiginitomaculum antarcticum TaxID=437507 RepID=UPI0003764365|nr:DNA polymerase III subunit alpha [Robiginitomaculum antarcticum]
MAQREPDFIHLRARSPYSLLEGAVTLKALAKWCYDHRMPAIGLTDSNNMCGALEFSETLKERGVQPIIGCTLSIDLELPGQPGQTRRDPDGTLVLLAQNETGYGHLMALSSAAYLDVSATDMPHILASTLEARSEGVIVLTGGYDGALDRFVRQGRFEEAQAWLSKLASIYGDRLYIELQRHDEPNEAQTESWLLEQAYGRGIAIVATNEPFFEDRSMHAAHDALLAISEGSYVLEKDRRKVTSEHFLKSPEMMVKLFEDLPEALNATIDIATRCAYASPKRAPILPGFGDENTSETDILRAQAHDGLTARLDMLRSLDEMSADEPAYRERLDFELDVIAQMGFPGYFLIVSDFIRWAKEQGIPVGPGRGSGAGSVVAWSLLITDLDPLRYGLLFERFLNPERVSMPDFDIDFCQERRSEVIQYVQRKYGKDQVAHIITFGTLQARAVVRDVGRVLQMPLGQVDRLAKMVPANPANPVTLRQAIAMEPRLREQRDTEPAVRQLLDFALELEGLYRNASTHAAGVVIGDRPLTELVPLYRDPRSDIPATQFNMKWVEKAGLVKFDFLGLKTLTVIDKALKYLAAQGRPIDLDRVSVTDKRAYEPLAEGASDGVFQLESSGMRDVLRKMRPGTIEELTALISLYRPGPMKNIDTYIDRKFGRVDIEYPHPMLKDILEETYGIIIYQEQVMQIAQVLSGFSLGEADLLRRAMGKKDQAEMDRQRSRFIEGAAKNDVDRRLANEIFDLVNEFAGYGFNKSHAAAYAMISFRTAYLKAHHPVEFLAATMALDIANTDKLAQFYAEAKRLELDVVAPDVNQSFADFEVREGKILYALGALKNVGVAAMQHVVKVREEGGAFTDIYDFVRRVDTRIVNKRALENLARAGAFDALEGNRAMLLASAADLQAIGARASEERSSAQVSLFGGADEQIMVEKELTSAPPWDDVRSLDEELSAVGFYLSGHPLEGFAERLEHSHTLACDLETAFKSGKRAVRMAGVLHKRVERMSQRSSKRFAFLEMSDPSGAYETLVNADLLTAKRDIMQSGTLLDIAVKIEDRDGEIKLYTNSVDILSGASGPAKSKTSEQPPRGVTIYIDTAEALSALKSRIDSLADAPARYYGDMHIIAPLGNLREYEIKLADRVSMDKRFLASLKSVPGVSRIETMAAL